MSILSVRNIQKQFGALFALDQLIAGVAILAVLGLVIAWLIGRAERRFLSWRT